MHIRKYMYIYFTFYNQLNRFLPTLITPELPEKYAYCEMKMKMTKLFRMFLNGL